MDAFSCAYEAHFDPSLHRTDAHKEAKDDSDASWRHMQNADSKRKVLIVSKVSEGGPVIYATSRK